jgi:quercetin dioxygenase-like cupin family protein
MAHSPVQPNPEPGAIWFDLEAEITALMQAPRCNGRSTRMLASYPQLRVLLVYLQKGARWEQHTAPGAITVQALHGRVRILADGDAFEVPAGRLLALASRVPHDVEAVDESVFLLTVNRERSG